MSHGKNGGKKCCDTVSLISSNEESHGQEKERENLPGFEKIVRTMLRNFFYSNPEKYACRV